MSALSAGACRALVFSLGLFSIAAYAGGDHAKPAKRYTLTPIVATNNAQCAPGFTNNTYTRRMNESGQVIGYNECWEATGDPAKPFLINAGWGYLFTPGAGSVLLPTITPGALGTFGRSVNKFGIAVGWEFSATSVQAPIWFPEGGVDYVVVSPCTTSGFPVSQADDINDHNSIAASSNRTSCGVRNWILRTNGGMEFLGPTGRPNALNNHDVLVGPQLNDAIKWSPALGTVVLQAGTPFERANAWNINDREEVVGEWGHSATNDQCQTSRDAMYWSPTGAATTLESLHHDTHGTALSIGENGLIVGYTESYAVCNEFDPHRRHAVIWHKGKVTDLNKLLQKSDARAIQLITASDINPRGQIAAYGFYRDEPLTNCWDILFDENGEEIYDTTRKCQSIHAFQLTPEKDD